MKHTMQHLRNAIIVILLFLLYSCEKSTDISQCNIKDIDSIPGLYTPVRFHSSYLFDQNVNNLLGCGYDCSYSDFNGVSEPHSKVIDLVRFALGQGKNPITGEPVYFPFTSINESVLHSGDEFCYWGTDLEDFETSLSSGYNISHAIRGIKLPLFMGEVTDMLSDTSKLSSLYSFYRISKKTYTYRMTLSNTTPDILQFFLTDEFLYDLKILSEDLLVRKYGTHVLTDVLLGGTGTFLFSGQLNAVEDKIHFQEQARECLKLIRINEEIFNRQLDFKRFKDVEVDIKTVGGINWIVKKFTNDLSYDVENYKFDFDTWRSSIKRTSEQLVGIGNKTTRIYWLSDYIDDPQKKYKVEDALIAYLKERELKMVRVRSLPYSDLVIGYQDSLYKYILSLDENNALFLKKVDILNNLDVGFDRWIFLPIGNYYRLQINKNNGTYYLSDQGVCEYHENSAGLLWKVKMVGSDYAILVNMGNGMCITHEMTFISYSKQSDKSFLWDIEDLVSSVGFK